MAARLKINGIEEVVSELDGIAKGVATNSSRAVTDSCRRIVKMARALCPIRTTRGARPIGALRASIGYTMLGPTLGVVGLAKPGSEYWHYVEFGTVHSAAQPFMRPAAESEQAPFEQEMQKGVQDAIDSNGEGAGGGGIEPPGGEGEPELPIPE